MVKQPSPKNVVKFDDAIKKQEEIDSNLDRIHAAFKAVHFFIKAKNYDEAKKLISEINHPEHCYTHAYTGDIYRLLGNYKKAISSYSRAIKCDDKYSEFFCLRGDCFCEMGYFENAICDFRAASEIDPNNHNYHMLIGVVLATFGVHDEAISAFENAIGLNPIFVRALLLRGQSREVLHDFEGALRDYDLSIKLEPKNVYYRTVRANLYAKLAMHKRALRDYQFIDKHSDEYPDAVTYQACCLCELGKNEKGFRLFLRSILRNPRDTCALYYFGLHLFHAKYIDQSTACFERVLEIDPMHNRSAYWLVTLIVDKGDVSAFDRAHQLAHMINNMYGYKHSPYLAVLAKVEALKRQYGEAIKVMQLAIYYSAAADIAKYRESLVTYRRLKNYASQSPVCERSGIHRNDKNCHLPLLRLDESFN